MTIIIISIAAFIGVVAMVGAVAFFVSDFGATKAEDRLEILTGKKSAQGDKPDITTEELLRESVGGVSSVFEKLMHKMGSLGMIFEQADSPIKPETFFGLTFFAMLAGVVIAAIARTPSPLYPVVGMFTGCFPLFWLMLRRRSRFKRFAAQLPDALELVGRALRSGHSLASGLHVVVQEMPAPISTEFGMAYEQQNLGVPLEKSLKQMLKRMPNLDLKFFVTAVAIQRQAGGDLAEILDKISYIIRERFKILGQVQALTGEGRISGIVLMALPIALFFAVYHLNPDYVMLLFTDELGQKMIGVAAILQVLGALAIKKIVAIKV